MFTINLDDLYYNDFDQYKIIRIPKQRKVLQKKTKLLKDTKQLYKKHCLNYRLKHYETLICECGGKYKKHYTKWNHMKTLRHINFINGDINEVQTTCEICDKKFHLNNIKNHHNSLYHKLAILMRENLYELQQNQ
jgi:hypothetical protein